jgi:hypothetical protein
MTRVSEQLMKVIHDTFLGKEKIIAIVGLLLLLLVSIFSITLDFVPANGDDLRLLSSVANTSNPMEYFYKEAGEGKAEYRPLLSVPLWFAYQVFGVRASINQSINLGIHFINVCLVLRIIRRVQSDIVLSFLLAGIFLVSINTVSSASWVADRPTLLVGMFLLLVVDHILAAENAGSQMRISLIVVMSILALMSKESGLIVILFSCFAVLQIPVNNHLRARLWIACGIIILSYMGLRIIVFGSQAGAYVGSGYALGARYENWSALPTAIKIIASIENVFKNFIGSFFPIFDWEGRRLYVGEMTSILKIFTLLSTALILLASYTRQLTKIQKYAISIIVLNSILNFAGFRYRTLYLSWIGVCIFIAASRSIKDHLNTRFIVALLIFVLLLCNTSTISKALHHDWLVRYNDLNKNDLRSVIYEFRNYGKIDPIIVEEVLRKYKKL